MQSSHLSAVTARTGNAERAAIHNFDKIWSRLVPDNRLRPWGLAKFMTELRKSDDINAPPATFHDSMTLLRFWHYAQHELDKLEINKDRFREWWINESVKSWRSKLLQKENEEKKLALTARAQTPSGTARPSSARPATAQTAAPPSARTIELPPPPPPRLYEVKPRQVQELRKQFDELFALHSKGAHLGKLTYAGRKLEKFMTALRRARDPNAPEATGNDALFLLKGVWAIPDADIDHYFVDQEKMRDWWVNEVFGYQGQKLNLLLTRHVLGKARPSFHLLPPGSMSFGKPTVNPEPGIIRDLVEGGFAMECERRPPSVYPPPRRLPGDDGHVHGAKSNRPAGTKELFALLSYEYGRIMGEGKEHSYAPIEGKKIKLNGGLPKPRHTRGSFLQLSVTNGTFNPPPGTSRSRPASARQQF